MVEVLEAARKRIAELERSVADLKRQLGDLYHALEPMRSEIHDAAETDANWERLDNMLRGET